MASRRRAFAIREQQHSESAGSAVLLAFQSGSLGSLSPRSGDGCIGDKAGAATSRGAVLLFARTGGIWTDDAGVPRCLACREG
jgi:hypothetical protein